MQLDRLKRRAFLTLLGSAAAWPLTVQAQQPAMPMIGFLRTGSPEGYALYAVAWRQGLKEAGYIDAAELCVVLAPLPPKRHVFTVAHRKTAGVLDDSLTARRLRRSLLSIQE